jgi:2-methylcitrate dehydratase
MLAVALLDDEVMPQQYQPDRISKDDVQTLLRRVRVRPEEEFTRLFPDEHACRLRVQLQDGREFEKEKQDYEGFHTRPMPWDRVVEKFERLSSTYTTSDLRAEIIETVQALERTDVDRLTEILREVEVPKST